MILCADDYGLSPAVSLGILELVEEKKLSAVSCMVLGPDAGTMIEKLTKHSHCIDIGLHLVLTNDQPFTPLSQETGLTDHQGRFLTFSELLTNIYRQRVDQEALHDEIAAQLSRFESLMGFSPNYIDGHQHVQQLPMIRQAVARAAKHRMGSGRTVYVRVGGIPLGWLCAKAITDLSKFSFGNFAISFPGRAASRAMRKFGVPHNRYLLGYYDYEGGENFEHVFRRYLTIKPTSEDIFFCHPGYIDDELRSRDDLVNSRVDVLQFLRSPAAVNMMDRMGVRLNTFGKS